MSHTVGDLHAFVYGLTVLPCEEIGTGLRCSERMGPETGWALSDWCYTCQARAVVGLVPGPTPMESKL